MNPNTVDIILILLGLIYVVLGYNSGMLRALLEPIAFGISLFSGMMYFDLTKNIVMGLLITIIGTLILTVLLKTALSLSRVTVDKQYRDYIFWGSRVAGGLLSLLWKGAITLSILFLIMFLPDTISGIDNIKANIRKSVAFHLMNRHASRNQPTPEAILDSLTVFKNDEKLQELSETPEFKQLYNSEKMQDLLSDESVLEMLRERNYGKLMTHPKIIALIKDDTAMKRLTDLSKKIYTMQAETPQNDQNETQLEQPPTNALIPPADPSTNYLPIQNAEKI